MTSTTTRLQQLLSERILLLDGAMGTMIQARRLSDAEFRGKVKGRFLGWEDVAKMAFEVILDEMRTLFELQPQSPSGNP